MAERSGSFRSIVTKVDRCKYFNSLELNGLSCITYILSTPMLKWQTDVINVSIQRYDEYFEAFVPFTCIQNLVSASSALLV